MPFKLPTKGSNLAKKLLGIPERAEWCDWSLLNGEGEDVRTILTVGTTPSWRNYPIHWNYPSGRDNPKSKALNWILTFVFHSFTSSLSFTNINTNNLFLQTVAMKFLIAIKAKSFLTLFGHFNNSEPFDWNRGPISHAWTICNLWRGWYESGFGLFP